MDRRIKSNLLPIVLSQIQGHSILAHQEITMTTDQKHPGENDLPHKPTPEEDVPHTKWEGEVNSENLKEVDAGEIAKKVKEDD